MSSLPEYWLRGPIPGIPELLQPVAHALLQAREEVSVALQNFPPEKLWDKPANLASIGFHLQHLRGVLDRLFSYAQDRPLSEAQLNELKQEGTPYPGSDSLLVLLKKFQQQIDLSITVLEGIPDTILTQPRAVGRAKLPSTVIGLLFHATEHTMRHTGQLLVTAKMLASS